MAPPRFVAADWSGRATGEARNLWLASQEGWAKGPTALHPASRTEAAGALLELAQSGEPLVVGLDFAFSLPAWWLKRCGVAQAPELWADRERLERWLLDCPPPFWGRRGHPRPGLPAARELRLTELAAAPRPRSPFQLGGAGSVGAASLRGMPVLDRLRREGFCVWPFDDWRLPAVVEVWPRLTLGRLVKSSEAQRRLWLCRVEGLRPDLAELAARSPDAFDALAALVGLVARGAGPRPSAPSEVVRLEGWIDGVPLARLEAGRPG